MPVLLTTDHGSIHCHTPATVFAKRDTTSNLRYKFGDDLRAQDADAALVVDDLPSYGLPARDAGHPAPARHRGSVLRLSHQAAGVPGPLPRRVPAWRRLPGGGHSSDRAADAATGLTVRTERRLLRLARPYRGLLALGLVTTFFASLLDGFTLVILIPLLKHLFGTAGSSRPGSSRLEASSTG